MKLLGIIPARGGSKGIHRKNIRPLVGKPLIQYTIDATKQLKELFYRVVVSTEDLEIAAISKNLGADVPFLRPHELATDESSSLSVVKDVVEKIEYQDRVTIDWIMVLQPTSPLRLSEDIIEAIEIMKDGSCDSVVSVKKLTTHHPIKAKKLDNGYLTSFIENTVEPYRRQELKPEAYLRNGAIYLIRRANVFNENFYGEKILPYRMPEERSIDIDTEADFLVAESLIRKRL